jgi:predicted GNAT superfamily acetyltransferase
MMPGDAERDAVRASEWAGVSVRALEAPEDLRQLADLFSRMWAAPVPPVPHDVMRSLVHAGERVHAAFRGGQLVGGAVAVFGPPADASCYSLITGVSPEVESRGIGLALKLAQRAWALRAGAARMTWTFDPLLRRNARFNLTRLGAVVTEYLVDFYGEITDGVNGAETDRLAVTWELKRPVPAAQAPAGTAQAQAPADAAMPPAILTSGARGDPVAASGTAADVRGPGPLRCEIPADILAVRRSDPSLARRWRHGVREALGGALAGGYRVTGLMPPGWYVLEKGEP